MRIGIAGPIGTEDIACLISGELSANPIGYRGAPFMASLIDELLKRGHEVIAFTTSTDISKPVSISSNTHTFRIHYAPSRSHGYLYRNGTWGKAMDAFSQERYWLKKAMLDANLNIVHAHWSYEFALAALDTGLPHLVTCHDAPQVVLRYMPNVYRLVRYFMARQALRRAHAVTAVSSYLKDMIQSYTQPDIAVIPNPLPRNVMSHNRPDSAFTLDSPRIAMVLNGWDSRKNPQPALRAFSLIHNALPGATLHIYGTDYGPDGKASQWARNHGISDGITFVGQVRYSDLLEQISRVDLVIHPSLEETFGMSIAEAMAMGVPVVGGGNSGAVPWIIGKAGLVVDVCDHNQIAESVINLLLNSERLKTMRELARKQTNERFSLESVVDAYEKLYLGIVQGRRES